jgi:O-antigen/teichoic acid export membrane protein
MSLRTNVLASYASQIYVALIGIVMVPVYLQTMGAEAFGLVGFFALLQAWFGLLDLGLTPTVARETARFRGGAIDALGYRRLVRALEGVFLALALAGGAALFLASGYVARDWLQASELPEAQVRLALRLMAVSIALRWLCGLYRGAVSGSERLVWLGGFNSAVATLRFVGVLPLLFLLGATPAVFFGYQFVLALAELAILLGYAYRLLPAIPAGSALGWNWAPLKPVLGFSLTIAFTSTVWLLVTQTDKLVLSRILPLAEYGYFTLAVLVAGGVMILSGPVGGAIMPRMAKLEAEGDHDGLIRIYRQSTQLVAILAGSVALTLAYCAEPLLWAWTGDRQLALQAGPVLALYALGNGVLAVAAFPYYLQYAKGDLRLHLIGNAVYVVCLVPAIIWAAQAYGSVGAGYVWLGLNLLSLGAWLPFVHHRFEPGLNRPWYLHDILAIALAGAAAGFVASHAPAAGPGRMAQAAQVLLVGAAVLVAAAAASSEARRRTRAWWARR